MSPLDASTPATLAALPPGSAARVVGTSGPPALQVRLWEMGLLPGTRVVLLKRAPLGDPLELALRGYHLSLRAAEARNVACIPVDASEEEA